MGRLFQRFLSSNKIYICSTCECHLANREDVESKHFHGRHGKAYLFSNVVNVCAGVIEKRLLRSGQYEVSDIYCKNCQELLGWKYEVAYEEEEKYKEGKYILEKVKMKHSPDWR